MSFDIASSSLRKFSACATRSDGISSLESLVTPSTSRGDFRAELGLDILERRERVLDRVVQERRRDGGAVKPHLGDDSGHLDRVREVRIAGRALLRAVGFFRERVGAID